jgi:hypothetical protein
MNKAKVKSASREISQALYEARNMAINWNSRGSNISIWVYFDSSNTEKNKIKFLSYPYNFSWLQIQKDTDSNIKLLKTYSLGDKIWIQKISSASNSNMDNILFFFPSISWEPKIFYWDWFNLRQEITDNDLDIYYSFNWANIWTPLSNKITYFRETNITDY